MAAASITPNVRNTGLIQSKSHSRYERFAGWLITLLITVGAGVFCMVAVWLSTRITTTQVAVPVIMDDFTGGGRPDGILGESLKVDAPEYNDVMTESNVEVEQAQVQDAAALVVDAIAINQADLQDPTIPDELEGGAKIGRQDGTGNAWALGEGPGQGGGVARGLRWKIRFDQTSQSMYARQLDFFKIELAAIKSGRVNYASGFTQASPARRSALAGDQEKRLFFTWEGGTMKKYDTALLQKAGVNTAGADVVVQFFPPDVENQLALLEKQRLGTRDARTVRRTVFGIRPAGNGFQFYVIEMTTF